MEVDDEDLLTELDFSVDDNIRALKRKLANERDRVPRPDSASSDDNEDSQLKLQRAMRRRQELLDRIRQQEQAPHEHRPRTYSPRRRYTPSPLPPPSRRSLPDLNRQYHFNWYNKDQPRGQEVKAMSQTKHIIEHQFRHAEPHNPYVLPPIQTQHAVPQVTTIQSQPPIIQQLPPVQVVEGKQKEMFNKADFMDMMMLQNAQMHHMVMQQMMLQNLPGGGGGGGSWKMPTAQVPMAPMLRMAPAPVMPYAAQAAAPVVHHYQPEMRGGYGYYGDYMAPWY